MNTIELRKSPFTVPNDYFEQFTIRVMEQIDNEVGRVTPQKAVIPTESKFRIILRYVSGIAAVLAFFAIFSNNGVQQAQAQQPYHSEEATSAINSNADEVFDYMMISNQQIYDYETSEE